MVQSIALTTWTPSIIKFIKMKTVSFTNPIVAGTYTNPTTTVSAQGAVTAISNGTATITTQDEGVTLSSSATTLNFVGAGVTASGGGATTTITIPGGGGGPVALAGDVTGTSAASTVEKIRGVDYETTFLAFANGVAPYIGIQQFNYYSWHPKFSSKYKFSGQFFTQAYTGAPYALYLAVIPNAVFESAPGGYTCQYKYRATAITNPGNGYHKTAFGSITKTGLVTDNSFQNANFGTVDITMDAPPPTRNGGTGAIEFRAGGNGGGPVNQQWAFTVTLQFACNANLP